MKQQSLNRTVIFQIRACYGKNLNFPQRLTPIQSPFSAKELNPLRLCLKLFELSKKGLYSFDEPRNKMNNQSD